MFVFVNECKAYFFSIIKISREFRKVKKTYCMQAITNLIKNLFPTQTTMDSQWNLFIVIDVDGFNNNVENNHMNHYLYMSFVYIWRHVIYAISKTCGYVLPFKHSFTHKKRHDKTNEKKLSIAHHNLCCMVAAVNKRKFTIFSGHVS